MTKVKKPSSSLCIGAFPTLDYNLCNPADFGSGPTTEVDILSARGRPAEVPRSLQKSPTTKVSQEGTACTHRHRSPSGDLPAKGAEPQGAGGRPRTAFDIADGEIYATPRLFGTYSVNGLLGHFRPIWASRGVRIAIFELGMLSTVRWFDFSAWRAECCRALFIYCPLG